MPKIIICQIYNNNDHIKNTLNHSRQFQGKQQNEMNNILIYWSKLFSVTIILLLLQYFCKIQTLKEISLVLAWCLKRLLFRLSMMLVFRVSVIIWTAFYLTVIGYNIYNACFIVTFIENQIFDSRLTCNITRVHFLATMLVARQQWHCSSTLGKMYNVNNQTVKTTVVRVVVLKLFCHFCQCGQLQNPVGMKWNAKPIWKAFFEDS